MFIESSGKGTVSEMFTLMLQSSPLKDKSFSRSFKTVVSGFMQCWPLTESTPNPVLWPVTGSSSNLDPAQPIFKECFSLEMKNHFCWALAQCFVDSATCWLLGDAQALVSDATRPGCQGGGTWYVRSRSSHASRAILLPVQN